MPDQGQNHPEVSLKKQNAEEEMEETTLSEWQDASISRISPTQILCLCQTTLMHCFGPLKLFNKHDNEMSTNVSFFFFFLIATINMLRKLHSNLQE